MNFAVTTNAVIKRIYCIRIIYFSFLAYKKHVAEWVKRLPADVAIPSLLPGDVNLFNLKRGSIAHILSLSPSHCPNITKILWKSMLNRVIYPSLYLKAVCHEV